MEQTFTYSNGRGEKFRATVTVSDNLKAIADQLVTRAIRQGRTSVKALDGAVALTLERVA